MISSLVRSASVQIQRHFLVSIHCPIVSLNQIVLSSVRQYKTNNNIKLNQQQSTKDDTEHSNSIDEIVLQEKLNCSREWAQRFCNTQSEWRRQPSNVLENIDFLLANAVRTNVLLNNPTMLTLSGSQLRESLNLVKNMNPVDINDFVPLVQLSKPKLLRLKKIAEKEENVVPKKHRIYYISEAMNIEPCEVTKYVLKPLFVLTAPFEMIDENLQILLKCIAPLDLLHDLWALNYKASTIEKRLNRAREGNIEKLMPWMVRCTGKKLSASIKIASDTKAIVGTKPLVKYLSERLKYNVETTKAIMQRHPPIFKCRVSRVKEMLDCLFDAGFKPVDFAQTPRVFSYSLKTIQRRVEELKAIGCVPQLNIICTSTNQYNQFVENWIRVRDKLEKKNSMKE